MVLNAQGFFWIGRLGCAWARVMTIAMKAIMRRRVLLFGTLGFSRLINLRSKI